MSMYLSKSHEHNPLRTVPHTFSSLSCNIYAINIPNCTNFFVRLIAGRSRSVDDLHHWSADRVRRHWTDLHGSQEPQRQVCRSLSPQVEERLTNSIQIRSILRQKLSPSMAHNVEIEHDRLTQSSLHFHRLCGFNLSSLLDKVFTRVMVVLMREVLCMVSSPDFALRKQFCIASWILPRVRHFIVSPVVGH